MNFSFHHSCVLITGASSGLGAEFARQLAPHVSTLILVARREERLENLAECLQKKYPALKLHVRACDLTSASEREKLASWVRQEKLPLNFLINNAGSGDLSDFLSASWERLQAVMDLNIAALTHLTYLFLPLLRQQSPSALLQVGSVAPYYPRRGNAVYSASKAYVKSFSQGLYLEEKQQQVIVTLLCPGPVPTEFYDVAAYPGKQINPASLLPTFLITSEKEVVSTALQGVLCGKKRVIPNIFLRIITFLVGIFSF
ncbi:MAG: SDR family NAD(P)-dependent oxidoreductase [Chthoniobacterales bacterium]